MGIRRRTLLLAKIQGEGQNLVKHEMAIFASEVMGHPYNSKNDVPYSQNNFMHH